MATSADVSGVRIDTEGAVSAVTAEGGDTLSMLQVGVGGYIDVVRLPEGIVTWWRGGGRLHPTRQAPGHRGSTEFRTAVAI